MSALTRKTTAVGSTNAGAGTAHALVLPQPLPSGLSGELVGSADVGDHLDLEPRTCLHKC